MKFGGQGGLPGEPLAGGGVGESEAPGVEHEAGGGALLGAAGVGGVAEEGVAEVLEVDPNLVGAAGVEGALNEGVAR